MIMFTPKTFLRNLRNQLTQLSNSKVQESAMHFFKEPVKVYGIPSATVQTLAKEQWKQIKDLDKKTIF